MKFRSWWWWIPVLLLAGCSRAFPLVDLAEGHAPMRTQPWDGEVVATLAQMPLQHQGRVKSLSSLASYTLYRVHGRRDVQMLWPGDPKRKETLTPVEWFLDVLCFPDQAADYPLFRIENVEVFDALGIAHDGGQRFDFEYLSYRQALTAAGKLTELAEQYGRIDEKERNPLQGHLVRLYEDLRLYHDLHTVVFAMARSPLALQGSELQKLYDGRERVGLGELLRRGPALKTLLARYTNDMEAEAIGNGFLVMNALYEEMQVDADPALFPALTQEPHARWLSLGKLIGQGMDGTVAAEHLAMLESLHTAMSCRDQAKAGTALLALARQSVALAERRGEAAAAALEADYLRWNLHYRALHMFSLAFLGVLAFWLVPRRGVWWLAMAVNCIPLGLLIADVVVRCLVTGRPPISNLYETFLFIAATGVIVALVIELIQRRGFLLSVAPLFGALLIFLARKFELTDGQDTMREIPAVLRSNFWLSTHVTTINIGYMAGLLASLLGTAYVLAVGFGARRDHPLIAQVHRATYGATCFGVLFAVVGTILGGVWAEDSWGRFWGWDPKENGALLICLSQIALLHARMSGWVRQFGFNLGAGVTGIVVAFSWFHVNLLGIGLHSYGFSGGLARGLYTYYGIELGLLLLAVGALVVRSQNVAVPAAEVAAVDGAAPAASADGGSEAAPAK